MRPSLLVASLAATASLLVATGALADEAPSLQVVAGTGGARLSDEDADSRGRLWIGFNAGGGLGTGGGLSGPTFDAAFRIGWVLNSQMAVYGNLRAMAWVAGGGNASSGGANVSLSAVGGQFITPMFAFTPSDLFEVAAGPSLDHLAGGAESAGASAAGGASASVSAFSGMYFGLDGRLALHLGGREGPTRRRRGFTISADVHPSFVPGGPITMFTLGLGADWF